jgi:hypothetical protein
MREIALRRWSFVSREFEHCKGLLGSSVQLAVCYKILSPTKFTSICVLAAPVADYVPGVSGTVQTTRHIEWIPAIREDHPLAIEYEGAICTSSHSRLYRSRRILRRRNLLGRQLPPHLLNPPDPSYRWAIDRPDTCPKRPAHPLQLPRRPTLRPPLIPQRPG